MEAESHKDILEGSAVHLSSFLEEEMVNHEDSESWRYDQQLFQRELEGLSAGVLNFSAAWFMAGNEVNSSEP